MESEQRPYHDPREVDQPSRFPALFPSLYAEKWGAIGLEHWLEDDLILGGPLDSPREELGEGIRHEGVRYLLLLGEHSSCPYNEWLVEAEGSPYWRIVFRTGIDVTKDPHKIVSVLNEQSVARFLRYPCLVEKEHLVPEVDD